VTSRNAILDGNEATASVAYRLNEVIAIYPITPSSPMFIVRLWAEGPWPAVAKEQTNSETPSENPALSIWIGSQGARLR